MLGQKKLQQAKEEVEQLVTDFSAVKESIKSLHKDVREQNKLLQQQKDFFAKTQTQQKSLLTQLETDIQQLQKHNQDLQNEVHNLKSEKISLKTSLTENFNQQVNKAIKQMEDALKVDTKKVDALTEELHTFKDSLTDAKAAIVRLTDMAKTVSEADLKLKEHAKALERDNKEKLKLLKRIDDLETILARMKRRR